MVLAYPLPNVGFHVFVDEGGDFGIKPLNPSTTKHGSRWFVLGAIAVSADNVQFLDKWTEEISAACGVPPSQQLHFRNLSADKRILACRMISLLPIRCFVFCSLKSNMRGYRNERAAAAANSKSWFYNSCLKYLLERITDFGLQWSIERFGEPRHVEIVLAEHPFVSISDVKDYLNREMGNIKLKRAVHKVRQLKCEVLNLGKLFARTPKEVSGLQLADIVASAFFSLLENSTNEKKPSELPAMALKRIVWDGTIRNTRKYGYSNNGLTVWPPYRPLKLEAELNSFFGRYGLDLLKATDEK